jgi:hypothetical protein
LRLQVGNEGHGSERVLCTILSSPTRRECRAGEKKGLAEVRA